MTGAWYGYLLQEEKVGHTEMPEVRNLRKQLEEVLKSLEDADPDIEGSALVRTDGLVMASAIHKDADESLIAAMSAALLNIGSRSVAELERGGLDKVIVSGTKGDVVLTSVAGEAVLSTITKPGANLGLVLVEMKRCSGKLGSALKS
jgi:predicted regulator of Ras-like GTPase activity (Roadblock/LC7/MglB family)